MPGEALSPDRAPRQRSYCALHKAKVLTGGKAHPPTLARIGGDYQTIKRIAWSMRWAAYYFRGYGDAHITQGMYG
jgi:hypothetical protein